MAAEFILVGEIQRQSALSFIGKLDIAKPWKITVARYVKKRSLSQNALLHLYLGKIAEHTGHDMDEIKDAMKDKFLTPTFIEIDGAEYEVRKSTAKMTTVELSEFVDRIYQFAASELGLLLPVPAEAHLEGRI